MRLTSTMQLTRLALLDDAQVVLDPPSRLLHFRAGLSDELARRHPEAPFREIVIRLEMPARRLFRRRSAIVHHVLEIPWVVDPDMLAAPYDAFRAYIMDAVEEALTRAGEDVGWDPSAALEAVRAVRGRERLGLTEFDWLRRRSKRDRATIHVFHDCTEVDARCWFEMRFDDGRVVQRTVRYEPRPALWWNCFPAHEARLTDVDYLVMGAHRRLLLCVPLDEIRAT